MTSSLLPQASETCVRNLFSIQFPIPNTVHICYCKPVNVPQPTPFRRRFYLRKTDWLGYSTQVDQNIDEVDATRRFSELYVLRLESIYQKGVELTIFLSHRRIEDIKRSIPRTVSM